MALAFLFFLEWTVLSPRALREKGIQGECAKEKFTNLTGASCVVSLGNSSLSEKEQR